MAYINGKKVLQVVQSLGGGASSTLLITTTDATLVSGTTYELALTYLTETPKINDFIAYVDNDLIKTLYKVTAIDSTNATLTKIADFSTVVANPTLTGTESDLTSIEIDGTKYAIPSGGGQAYEHHIWLLGNNSDIDINIIIKNDSNNEINTLTKLKNALRDLGWWNNNNYRPLYTKVNGWKGTSVVVGLANLDNGKLYAIYASTNNEDEITSTTLVQDTIKPA